MMKKTMGIAFSAILLAGAFALTANGASGAESVMKQCGADWKAAKAAGTTNGQTWQEFLKACRAQKEGAAAPAPAISSSGTAVAFEVTGGVVGESHLISVQIVTSVGEKYQGDVTLRVVE